MHLLHRESASQKREGRHIANLRCGHQRPDPTEGWRVTAGGRKKKKKEWKKKEVPVPSAQKPKVKGNSPRRSLAARSSDAVRVSAKDGESYGEILKAMRARVNPQDSGAKKKGRSCTRGSFSGNMKSSGKRALSTWVCSWIEGLASANT